MTATADELKQFALDSGADLMGVAPVWRFDEAPVGHHPEDILPGARAVVAFARRIPAGTLDGPSTAYHRMMEVVHTWLDELACRVALFLEEEGVRAVPVPADEPYRHWDAQKVYGRGDLSHKHAAQAAGLGRLGRNSLLVTPQFGNRVELVSVVTDLELTPDSVIDWEPCPPDCSRCLRACPVGAIGEGQRVDQALCRMAMLEQLPKGALIESCWICRGACPVGLKQIRKRKDP